MYYFVKHMISNIEQEFSRGIFKRLWSDNLKVVLKLLQYDTHTHINSLHLFSTSVTSNLEDQDHRRLPDLKRHSPHPLLHHMHLHHNLRYDLVFSSLLPFQQHVVFSILFSGFGTKPEKKEYIISIRFNRSIGKFPAFSVITYIRYFL